MKWVGALALFLLLFCVHGSLARGSGGGWWQRVFSSSRGGGGSCSQEQRDLACDLFRHWNVRAARRHPSGQRDNAYAYNNLRDMCNGERASRSSYYCGGGYSAPGGSTCLSTNLLRYLGDLADGGQVIINELAGACHSRMSRHYSGLAVDLHKDHRQREYEGACRRYGGRPITERNHVHCQFSDGPHPNW